MLLIFSIVRHFFAFFLALFSVAFFFSCAEDDGRESDVGVELTDRMPDTPAAFEAVLSREEVLADYQNYLATAVSNNGWTGDVSTCEAGDVPMLVREQAVKRWDYYRRQVGFTSALVLDEVLSREAQQTALLMKANNILTHFPTKDMEPKCYTSKAAEYALFNLAVDVNNGTTSARISAFMADVEVGNELVRHRVWLLHPNVHHVVIAATNDYVVAGWRYNEVLYGPQDPAIANGLIFASWPPAGFVVADLVYDRWSLHYFEKVNDEDIEQAEIAMVRKDTSEDVALRVIARHNEDISGLRTIVWEPEIEKPASGDKDIIYQVFLRGFMVEGEGKKVDYEVTLIHANES